MAMAAMPAVSVKAWCCLWSSHRWGRCKLEHWQLPRCKGSLRKCACTNCSWQVVCEHASCTL